MVGSAITAGNGVVLIEIPDDGAPGDVLTKLSAEPFDFAFLPPGGGGGTIIVEDEGVVVGVPADTLDFVGAGVIASGAGTTKTITIPGGASTLQAAYDAATAVPQISVVAGDPLTIDLAVAANDVFALRNAVNADILRVSDTTGVMTGIVLTIDDALTNGGVNSLVLSDTYTETGAFIGGGILSNGTITFTNAVWIWALMQESKAYLVGVDPGFAAFTLFNALATIGNSGNFNLVQAIVLNSGVSHRRVTAGTSTTTANLTVNASPNTRTLIAGAVMTKTAGDAGLQFGPTHGTVALSTVNHGTLRGLFCLNPGPGFFQPSAGTEAMTAYVGVEINAIPFGGNVTKRGFRSALTAATLTLMIENTGGAASDFGTGIIHLGDTTPIQFGGGAVNAQDVSLFWNAANATFDMFFAANSETIRISNPVTNEFLITGDDPADEQLQMNFRRFSFGGSAPTGSNWWALFAPPSLRLAAVVGEYSDVLFSQAGALDVNGLALTNVQNWKINVPSILLSGGTIDDLSNLFVDGMNSFGATRVQALRVGGRARIDGRYNAGSESPAQLTANTNDWQLAANNGQREVILLTTDGLGPYNVTGIDSSFGFAQDGDFIEIINISVDTITFTDQDVLSLAANRFITATGAGIAVGPNESIRFWYDDTGVARWRHVQEQ